MKKLYANPQIHCVFMDQDVITTSNVDALAELDWRLNSSEITR